MKQANYAIQIADTIEDLYRKEKTTNTTPLILEQSILASLKIDSNNWARIK